MNTYSDFYNQFKTFVFGILIFLNIDKDVLIFLFCLIMINMATGGLKAIMIPEMKFSLDTWWAGLAKKSLLIIMILAIALLTKGLGFHEFKPLVTIVMKAMLLSEAIKILNNIRSIFDKKEHQSSDFISVLIGKMTDFFGFQINKLLTFFDK